MEKKPDWERVEIAGIVFFKCNNKKAWERWMIFVNKLINWKPSNA